MGFLRGVPVAYPYLLSERIVTAVISYRHDLLDLMTFPAFLMIDDLKAYAQLWRSISRRIDCEVWRWLIRARRALEAAQNERNNKIQIPDVLLFSGKSH